MKNKYKVSQFHPPDKNIQKKLEEARAEYAALEETRKAVTKAAKEMQFKRAAAQPAYPYFDPPLGNPTKTVGDLPVKIHIEGLKASREKYQRAAVAENADFFIEDDEIYSNNPEVAIGAFFGRVNELIEADAPTQKFKDIPDIIWVNASFIYEEKRYRYQSQWSDGIWAKDDNGELVSLFISPEEFAELDAKVSTWASRSTESAVPVIPSWRTRNLGEVKLAEAYTGYVNLGDALASPEYQYVTYGTKTNVSSEDKVRTT